MRTPFRFVLAALFVAAAIPAWSQATPCFGLAATPGCGTLMDNNADNAILVGVKITAATGACTDILWDFTETAGLSVGGATVGNPAAQSWLIPPNWAVPQSASDGEFALLIYPPAAGSQANRIMIDSGTTSNQDFSVATVQTVGNSLPVSYNSPANGGTVAGSTAQGIGLSLASAATYGVKLRGTGGSVTAGFPRGANGGVEVAFGPLAEVNDQDLVGGGCTIAGQAWNPVSPANRALSGAILGYNVYRVSGTAGTTPPASAFLTAALDATPADGWQYFIPLTQSYNLTAPDTNPGVSTPPAPSDMNANDLGGLQNPDGVMYSGDEVMIFQDSAANRGTGRPANSGAAPVAGTGYWYAFQPVLCGAVPDFASPTMGFSNGRSQFIGDHVSSLSSLAAGDDAVDLDLNGTVDFFSPQADIGLPGLGLMYNGGLVLSQPVFGMVDPAPAGGTVSLSGHVDGQNVNITFQTGLETGDVQSFNVYRGVGAARVRVNGQPIVAQGTESSVYQLVDDAVQARRLARSGVIEYSVETVYADGHTSMVGPFAVTLDRQAPARRSR